MKALQMALDDLLIARPEMTFSEAVAELVEKGKVDRRALENTDVHVYLYQLFQRAKILGQRGRVNKDL